MTSRHVLWQPSVSPLPVATLDRGHTGLSPTPTTFVVGSTEGPVPGRNVGTSTSAASVGISMKQSNAPEARMTLPTLAHPPHPSGN
jgi:hypothetical protein